MGAEQLNSDLEKRLKSADSINNLIERLKEVTAILKTKDISPANKELVTSLQSEILNLVYQNLEDRIAAAESMDQLAQIRKEIVEAFSCKKNKAKNTALAQACVDKMISIIAEAIENNALGPLEKLALLEKYSLEVTKVYKEIYKVENYLIIREGSDAALQKERSKEKPDEYKLIIDYSVINKEAIITEASNALFHKIDNILRNDKLTLTAKILMINRERNTALIYGCSLKPEQQDLIDSQLSVLQNTIKEFDRDAVIKQLEQINGDASKSITDKLAEIDLLICTIYIDPDKADKIVKEKHENLKLDLTKQLSTLINAEFNQRLLTLNPEELTNPKKYDGLETPTMNQMMRLWNTTASLVITSIVNQADFKARMTMIETWLNVAEYCLDNNNLEAGIAIYSGLNSEAIQRYIRSSTNSLNKDAQERWKKISTAFSDANAYENMRKLMHGDAKDTIVPHLGLLRKDIIMLQEKNPDTDLKLMPKMISTLEYINALKKAREGKKYQQQEMHTYDPSMVLYDVNTHEKTLDALSKQQSEQQKELHAYEGISQTRPGRLKRTLAFVPGVKKEIKLTEKLQSLREQFELYSKNKLGTPIEVQHKIKEDANDLASQLFERVKNKLEKEPDEKGLEKIAQDVDHIRILLNYVRLLATDKNLLESNIKKITEIKAVVKDNKLNKTLDDIKRTLERHIELRFQNDSAQAKLAATSTQPPNLAAVSSLSMTTVPSSKASTALGATNSAPAILTTTSRSITGAKAELADSDIKPIAVSIPERSESFNYTVQEDWDLYWQQYDKFLLNAIAEKFQAAPSDELKDLYNLQQKKIQLEQLRIDSESHPENNEKKEAFAKAFIELETLRLKIPATGKTFSDLRVETHKKVAHTLKFTVNPEVIESTDQEVAKGGNSNYQAAFKGRLLIVIKTPTQNAEVPFNKLQALKTELQLDLNQGQAIRDFSNANIIQALKAAAAILDGEEHQNLVKQFMSVADQVALVAKEIREHKEDDAIKLAEFIEAKLKENDNFYALIMLEQLGLRLAAINPEIGKMVIARGQSFNSINSQGRNWVGKYVGHLKNMEQAELAGKFEHFSVEANRRVAKKAARNGALEQFIVLEGGYGLLKTQVPTSEMNALIIEVKELLTPFVKEEGNKPSGAQRENLLSKMNQLLDDILKKCAGKLDKELSTTEINDIEQMIKIAKSLALFTGEFMNATEFTPRQIIELNGVVQQLKTKNPTLIEMAEDFQKILDNSLQNAITTVEKPLVITTLQQIREKLAGFAGLNDIQSVLDAISQVAEKQQMLTVQLAKAVTYEEHEKVINKAEIAFTDPMRTLITWVEKTNLNISEDAKKSLLIALYDEQSMLSDYVSKMKTIANAKMLESRPRVGAIAKSATPAHVGKVDRRAVMKPVSEMSPNLAEVWAAKLSAPLTPLSFIDFQQSHWEIYWKLYDEKISVTHSNLAAHLAVAQSLNLSVPEHKLIELDSIASRAGDDYKQTFQRAVKPNLNVQFPDAWRIHWAYFDKQSLSDEQFTNTEIRLALHKEALKRVGYGEQTFNSINELLVQADAYAWQRSAGDDIKYREYIEKYIKGRFNLMRITPEVYKNPTKLAGLSIILGEKKDGSTQDVLSDILEKYGKDNARLLSGFAALVAKLYRIYEDYNNSQKDLGAFEDFTNALEANYKNLIQLQFYYQDLMALLEDSADLKTEASKWDSLVIAAVQVVSSTLPALKDIIDAYNDIDLQDEDAIRIKALQAQYKKISEISNFHQRMIDRIKAIKIFPGDSKKNEVLNSQLMALKDVLREYILQPDASARLLRDKVDQQLKSIIPVLLQNIVEMSSKTKLDEKQAEALRQCFEQLNNLMQLSDQINGVPYPFTVAEKQQLLKSCQLTSNLINAETALGLRDVIHYLHNHDFEIISSALAKIDVKSADTIESKLIERMKNKKIKIGDDEVDLFTAAKKFNPREDIQFINERAFDELKLANPALNKYSYQEFISVFDNYLKIKATLENLASFQFNNEKGFTYIKDRQTHVIDEAEWKELQQQNPLLLAISFKKAKEHFAAVRTLSADYVLINGALAKRSVNREPIFIKTVSESDDSEVAILRNIIPLIDLLKTYSQFKLPQKLGSYRVDDLIAALTMITGGNAEGPEKEKSILTTYDKLKKLLQNNGLLDDQLSKQLDAERAQFVDMAKRLEQAIEAKKQLPTSSTDVTLKERLGVLQRLGEVIGLTRTQHTPETSVIKHEAEETRVDKERLGILQRLGEVIGLTRAQPIPETPVIKHAPEEMRIGTEAPLPSSVRSITGETKLGGKSLFLYLRDAVISVVDHIRGKKSPIIQPTREASVSEVSEVLYGSPKTASSADLPSPPSQLLAAKAPSDISGKLPLAPTTQTTLVTDDLYSDIGIPVEVRSDERIKEQAHAQARLAAFIKQLKDDIEFAHDKSQQIHLFMTANENTLSAFNKDELIEVAKVDVKVAQWLFNHAKNIDTNYADTLGDDGLTQVEQLANMPVKVTSRLGASQFQALTIDEIEQAILAMRDANNKPYVKAAEFIAFERFNMLASAFLPTLPKQNQKAERVTIELALIKHNIKVGQQFSAVPPNGYEQKMDNFKSSLKLFNNVIVVALHSLLEKFNFTNHYDQLNKIRAELIAQLKEIESYQKALGAHLNAEKIDSMGLSAIEKEQRVSLLKDAQAKSDFINNEIKRIDDLRSGFSQGVQKKLQAVRAFLPKPPLELPTHAQLDSSIKVTPSKLMPDVKEQIYVKVKDKNEFKPLSKEQKDTLITEMHFKIDKNSVTSYVPRKAYDESALRALAKEMVLKAREAYGKDMELKIDGKGKLLEFAKEEYEKSLKLEAKPAALNRDNSVRMPPRPKSTPSS